MLLPQLTAHCGTRNPPRPNLTGVRRLEPERRRARASSAGGGLEVSEIIAARGGIAGSRDTMEVGLAHRSGVPARCDRQARCCGVAPRERCTQGAAADLNATSACAELCRPPFDVCFRIREWAWLAALQLAKLCHPDPHRPRHRRCGQNTAARRAPLRSADRPPAAKMKRAFILAAAAFVAQAKPTWDQLSASYTYEVRAWSKSRRLCRVRGCATDRGCPLRRRRRVVAPSATGTRRPIQ